MSETQFHVTVPLKNVGVSVVLSIFFGGLGLLYSDVKAGVIMTIVQFVNLAVLIVGGIYLDSGYTLGLCCLGSLCCQ